MGITIPGWLDKAADIAGVDWPNIDEDEFRELADAYREFAEEVDGAKQDSMVAAAYVLSDNSGRIAEAFEAHHKKLADRHLHDLAQGARLLATSLDAAALIIEGAKARALVQLGILAAAITAAIAASTITLGLSALAGLAEREIVRRALKRIFKELEEELIAEATALITDPIIAGLEASANELLMQGVENMLGAREGVDTGAVVDSGVKSGKEALPGQGPAAQTELASAAPVSNIAAL